MLSKEKDTMSLKKIFFLIALLVGCGVFGQKAEVDLFCQTIDSTIVDNKSIVSHIVRHQTDYDSARYYDRYFIDTSKGILVKSIYSFDFGGGEYLEFYYRNNEIIKVNATHNLDDRKFARSFYFKSEKLIAHTDGEISPGKIVFDVKQILKTGNDYMINAIDLMKSLKK